MLNKKSILSVGLIWGLCFGCVTAKPIQKSAESKKAESTSEIISRIKVEDLNSAKPSQSLPKSSQDLEESEEIASNDAKLTAPVGESDDEGDEADIVTDSSSIAKTLGQSTLEAIPIEMNEDVERWIKYFTERDRERFQRFLHRGSQYRDVVENLLEENGVPPQLYYLAMIESGYSPRATSIAKAAGVWQFIPSTGKRYGLEVNHYTDERRDPIRATEAAAKYLKDLYNVFGSWYLAIAAYNAGEFRIMTSVIRGKSRDFWTLVKMKVLPVETANYIPKFLAAITIGENPDQYGFDAPQADKYPNLESVEVPSPIRLVDLASTFNIPLMELQKINPNLRRNMTPPYSKSYEVWVPEEKAKQIETLRVQLAKLRLTRPRLGIPGTEQGKHYHVVRSGETIKLIAQKYKVSPRYLKRLNRLSSNKLYAGTRLRVTAKSYHPKKVTRYYVKRGDNLRLIAKRFGVTVQKLKVMNSIRGNTIAIGQVLKVASEGT